MGEHGPVFTCEQMAIILETVACGIFTVSPAGIITYWNRAAEEITGWSAADMVGQPCSKLDSELCSGAGCSEGVLTCGLFERGRVDRKECAIRRKDGTRVQILKNARVMIDQAGRVLGGVESITDISYVRDIERRLETLRRDMAARFSMGNIIGRSPPMQDLYRLLERAAESDATVLLLGESGTGKELAARAIHTGSRRAGAPFVAVNCSALTETVLESELFGHVRGAFTGAVADRMGRFELADGGTLFLDEIGDLSPVIQLKLLRVIQERKFERVGESQAREADVRIIAATHRNLVQLMEEGRFREDLYYRLKVFPISLPPLRDRREDIPLLVDHFIGRFNAGTGKQIQGVTSAAMHLLLDHDWPGNIRELENAIEHAFVLCSGDTINVADLPRDISGAPARVVSTAGPPPPRLRARAVTAEQIRRALDAASGNRSEAARRLGISRVTLYKKLRDG